MRFHVSPGGRTPSGAWLLTCVLPALIAVAIVLGCDGAPKAEPPQDAPWLDPVEQIKLLKTGDYRLQVLAANNLGNLGALAADSVPELERLQDNPNPKVRQAARTAIEKIRKAMGGDAS